MWNYSVCHEYSSIQARSSGDLCHPRSAQYTAPHGPTFRNPRACESRFVSDGYRRAVSLCSRLPIADDESNSHSPRTDPTALQYPTLNQCRRYGSSSFVGYPLRCRVGKVIGVQAATPSGATLRMPLRLVESCGSTSQREVPMRSTPWEQVDRHVPASIYSTENGENR